MRCLLLLLLGSFSPLALGGYVMYCADAPTAVPTLRNGDFNFRTLSSWLTAKTEKDQFEQPYFRWTLKTKDGTAWNAASAGNAYEPMEETRNYFIWDGYTDDRRQFHLEVHRIARPGSFLRPGSLLVAGRRTELVCYFYGGEYPNNLCDLYAFPGDGAVGASRTYQVSFYPSLAEPKVAAAMKVIRESKLVDKIEELGPRSYRVRMKTNVAINAIQQEMSLPWCRGNPGIVIREI